MDTIAPRTITAETIGSIQAPLESHPVYGAIDGLARLRLFMEHHIYSVWDFMSLIKYLQARVAPVAVPWRPIGDGSVRRFINELVLEEESDEGPDGGFASHFELYCGAMREIGADPAPALGFVATAAEDGISAALDRHEVPVPARAFLKTTFGFIAADRPHEVAAALALGREHIIPMMFRRFLSEIGVDRNAAPVFHFYLERHIHLDEDFHAPLSLKLLNALCEGDATKIAEAEAAARAAVAARIAFWDGVLAELKAA